jgi:MinD-like ATPase involved in chromosome partitioning or flagellar assembly
MGKVTGIIAIKGGVGKTSTVSLLGASLANDFQKKVLLIDANFSAPNLGMHVGILNPEVTIHHVLDNKASVKDAICETIYGFDVIPGSMIYEKVNPYKLAEKIRDLRRRYDVILIDSSPNLNEEILATMMASDELFVVTTPDIVTLSSTLRAVRVAKEKRTPISGIILNKVYDKKFEVSLEDIEKASGCDVLAVLPHDVYVLEALSRGIPSTLNRNSPSTKEYRKLAGTLAGKDFKEGKIKSILRTFMKSVPKQEVNRTVLKQKRINNYI